MEITPQMQEQFAVFMQQLLSFNQHMAFYQRKLKPCASVVNGGASFAIPDATKSFNIINLGQGGNGLVMVDIPVTGIQGLTAIPKNIRVFGFTIENDQNCIEGPVTVSPPVGHTVVVQYLQ